MFTIPSLIVLFLNLDLNLNNLEPVMVDYLQCLTNSLFFDTPFDTLCSFFAGGMDVSFDILVVYPVCVHIVDFLGEVPGALCVILSANLLPIKSPVAHSLVNILCLYYLS